MSSSNCTSVCYTLLTTISTGAAVRLKLEEHGLAIADSSTSLGAHLPRTCRLTASLAARAIELDPRAVKVCLLDLAVSRPSLIFPSFPGLLPPRSRQHRYHEAQGCRHRLEEGERGATLCKAPADVATLQVLSLDPKNTPAKAQLDATQKLLRRLQFEAAISSKDEIATSIKVRRKRCTSQRSFADLARLHRSRSSWRMAPLRLRPTTRARGCPRTASQQKPSLTR